LVFNFEFFFLQRYCTDKFSRGYWQLLQITHICQRVVNTLILVQRVLITLRSNCQWVLDNLYWQFHESCLITKKRQTFRNTFEETKS
jgi:hypothetical protein